MEHILKKFSLTVATGIMALSFPSAANAFTLSPTPGFYDEAVYEDLSDEGSTPTDLGSLIPGVNKLKASFFREQVDEDTFIGLDYFTFTIEPGYALESIFLNSWSASPEFEDIAFIAMQEGDVFDFTFPNDNPEGLGALGLLGWSHLRSTQVGTNKILEEMAISNLTPENGGIDEAYFQAEVDMNPYEGLGLTDEEIDMLEANLLNLALPNNSQGGAIGFDTPLKAGTYSVWLRQGNTTEISVDVDFNTTRVPEPTGVLGTAVAVGLATLLTKKRKRS